VGNVANPYRVAHVDRHQEQCDRDREVEGEQHIEEARRQRQDHHTDDPGNASARARSECRATHASPCDLGLPDPIEAGRLARPAGGMEWWPEAGGWRAGGLELEAGGWAEGRRLEDGTFSPPPSFPVDGGSRIASCSQDQAGTGPLGRGLLRYFLVLTTIVVAAIWARSRRRDRGEVSTTVGHAVLIGALAFFLDGALGFRPLIVGARSFSWLRLAPVIVLALAGAEELAQSLSPARTCSFSDFAGDVVGVFALSALGAPDRSTVAAERRRRRRRAHRRGAGGHRLESSRPSLGLPRGVP